MTEPAAFTAAATTALVNRLAAAGLSDARARESIARLSDDKLAHLIDTLALLVGAASTEHRARQPRTPRAPHFVGRWGKLQSIGGEVEWQWFSREYTSALVAAQSLRDEMAAHGLRQSEMDGPFGHLADLANGDRLTADDWTAFEVVHVA